MLAKWKEQRITKKITKLRKLPVFHQQLEEVAFQLGTYRPGRMRPFDLLHGLNTKEHYILTNVTIDLTDQQHVRITGTNTESGTLIDRSVPKDMIKWSDFLHHYNIGLNQKLELCTDLNGGTLDITLTNGDSLLLGYTFDKTKEFRWLDL